MTARAKFPRTGDAALRTSAQDLLEWAPDAVVVSDEEGRIVFANAEAEKLFGYPRTELINAPVEILMSDRFRRDHERRRDRDASQAATPPMGIAMALVGRRKDGSEFPVEISLSAMRSGGGLLTTSFIRDVSERQRMAQHLQNAREVSSVVLNSLDAHIAVLDAPGMIIAANDAWKRFVLESGCEFTEEGGLGTDGLKLCRHVLQVSSEARSEVLRGIESVLDGSQPRFVIEYRNETPATETWSMLKVTALSDEGRGAVIYHTDITQRKQLEQTLFERARRDALTGALNHGAIAGLIRGHLADGEQNESFAVALIDVDGLKVINDTYGHAVGDEALVAVARAISADGAVVGRYGGDEFVAILPGADHAAAQRYKWAVRDNLATTRIVDTSSGSRIALYVSIGFAFYPDDARAADQLLRLADAAMYSSRASARVSGGGLAPSLAADRCAATIREIIPLVTSSGELREKLRLAAHRLSTGVGYDAVGIEIFGEILGIEGARGLYARLSDDIVRMLDNDFSGIGGGTFRVALEHARRPISLDSPATDERLSPEQRASLGSAGLRSVLLLPIVEEGRLIGALTVASHRPAAFSVRDGLFLTTVAAQIAAIARMSALVDGLRAAAKQARQAHRETVMMLAATAEAHDHTTGLHLQSIRTLSEVLARELGYGSEAAEDLGLAATLHDIGKIRVPKEILLSPDALTETEWAVVKQHTTWGAEFLIHRPEYSLAAAVAEHHHERWDGNGYPAGLRGHEIPEAASIVAVADAFDAMTHDRPYRPALPLEDVIGRIVAASGTQFSPKVVGALVSLHERGQFATERDQSQQDAA